MYDKHLLGKRIKELRKQKGFTQESLAEKAGVDAKHLSRIECGVNFPSLDLIGKISSILQIDTSLFFQTSHLKSRQEIVNEINKIINNAEEKDLRIFYKVLSDIV